MGSLTRAQIVTQGLQRAGRTDLNARATEALRTWLKARARDWPFLWTRKSREGLVLGAGVVSLSVGGGDGGITNEVQRILNPIWVYNTTYTTRSNGLIMSRDSVDLDTENRINNPATVRGLPTQFKILASTSASGLNAQSIVPVPLADKSYLLVFDYIETELDPIPLTTTVPKYPNEQTMIAFVEMIATKWANGASDPDYQALKEEVGLMIAADRIHDGQSPGSNDAVQLDPGVFK